MYVKFLLVCGVFFFWFALFQGNVLVEKFRNAADSIVYDALSLQAQGEYDFGGFLVRGDAYKATNTDQESPIPSAYLSRLGIQFQLFSLIWPRIISLETYLKVLSLVMAFLLAATLAFFVLAVRREFGVLPAIGAAGGVLSSPWLILYSASTSWSIFASFLPFAFSWALYKRFQKRLWLFCLCAGILVFLKALFGYEYLSSIILSMLVPIIYYEMRQQSPWLQTAKNLAFVFVSGLLGFFAALMMHIYQGAAYLGSASEIMRHIAGKAVERSVVYFPSFAQIVSDYLFGPAYLKTSFFASIVLPGAYLGTMGIFLFGLSFLGFFWWKHKKSIQRNPGTKRNALFLATAFSYLASFSWAVLMPSAMATHPQLSGIIFYLPTNLMVMVFFFFVLSGLFSMPPRAPARTKRVLRAFWGDLPSLPG